MKNIATVMKQKLGTLDLIFNGPEKKNLYIQLVRLSSQLKLQHPNQKCTLIKLRPNK